MAATVRRHARAATTHHHHAPPRACLPQEQGQADPEYRQAFNENILVIAKQRARLQALLEQQGHGHGPHAVASAPGGAAGMQVDAPPPEQQQDAMQEEAQ